MIMSEEQKYLEVLNKQVELLKKAIHHNANEMATLNELMEAKRNHNEQARLDLANTQFEVMDIKNKIKGVE